MPFASSPPNWRALAGLVMLPFLASGFALADEKPPQQEATTAEVAEKAEKVAETYRFVRVVRDKNDEPAALETSIMRFVSASDAESDLQVDLVGVVHVGDRKYYRQLNKRFKEYDAVLYELVAPEDANVPKPGRRGAHPVSLLQTGMKDALDLEFQLDVINYKAKNFVHADMTPEEMAESMKKREESFFKMFFRAMGQGAAQQGTNPTGEADMLMALFSKDRPRQMKLIMAEQLQNVETSLRVLEGPNGSTLIGERNGKAMEVLRKSLDDGKLKVAIFYGAGHLPDMEQRLIKDFDMKYVESEWLRAWDLKE